MERKRISFGFWILAFLITVLAAIYQRATGPNHPDYEKITLNEVDYKLKLDRDATTDKPCEILLKIKDEQVTGTIYFRRYPTNEEWQSDVFKPTEDGIVAYLPIQPSAGKLAYYIELSDKNGTYLVRSENPVIVRYNDPVPAYVLIPHIFCMFVSMMLAAMVLFLAVSENLAFRSYLFLTFVIFTVGGMILGPFVQKFAFGEYWTGVPFGWDLTDNKTLIAWLFFLIAVIANYRKTRSVWAIVAVVIMFLIYLVPHSMFGSELDPNTGEIISA